MTEIAFQRQVDLGSLRLPSSTSLCQSHAGSTDVINAGCFIKQHGWGKDRDSGVLPLDALFGMSPMGRNGTCACGFLPFPSAGSAQLSALPCKQRPEALQSAS